MRLCKGIYIEPASIAFRDAEVVRRSFVAALDALLEGGSRVAIATHDEALLAASLERVAGLGPDGYEFQMLLGVRESRATSSWRRAIRSGSTSPSGSAGTSTRSAACRRTRRWRA